MVGPEVDHHFLQLALREGCADHGELLELAGETPGLTPWPLDLSPWPLGLTPWPPLRVAERGNAGEVPHHGVGPLSLAARTLRIDVEPGEIVPAVAEEVEAPLALGQTGVVDVLGRELLIDPAHHPALRHAVHVARAGPVGEAVQRVDRGVARGKRLAGKRRRQRQRRADRHTEVSHTPILTTPSVPS